MLAERVDGVIGVDTHRDTLAAAAVSPIGAVTATTDAPANARGYRRLLDFARQHVPGRRCWALEGVGSYGAGLAAFLAQAGEQVVEVLRPKRAAARGGRKTDMIDAIRAAKEAPDPGDRPIQLLLPAADRTGPRGPPGGRRRTRHADSSEYRFVYLLPTWHYFLRTSDPSLQVSKIKGRLQCSLAHDIDTGRTDPCDAADRIRSWRI
ncbi:transposase [Streptomyces sp. NBC_00846]|uniref:IS110 family transposase n=1 Tax=Streptomyces sp. NBC_00846 TaxID=2975849 RepID=UPI00386EFC67|nr:transposase [Streptomyces sp. NBC_00846]